jgi:hypothetical protein
MMGWRRMPLDIKKIVIRCHEEEEKHPSHYISTCPRIAIFDVVLKKKCEMEDNFLNVWQPC